MELNVAVINAQIRAFRDSEGSRSSGTSASRDRVAVYAVAVGERLGLDLEALIGLRVAAELIECSSAPAELVALVGPGETSRQIVELCREFDARRIGDSSTPAMTDVECVAWLDGADVARFEGKIVAALRSVQSVIQPIGT
jgi:hypothetical protein